MGKLDVGIRITSNRALSCIHRNLQRHRAVSLRQHGFLVTTAVVLSCIIVHVSERVIVIDADDTFLLHVFFLRSLMPQFSVLRVSPLQCVMGCDCLVFSRRSRLRGQFKLRVPRRQSARKS